MTDFVEVDFLGVETLKSGDAITVRYRVGESTQVHVVDGGYIETGEKIVAHLKSTYGTSHVDHLVLTHPDQDHANGLRSILEHCTVGRLWMNRPWIYAEQLIDRFETYSSVDALRRKLRSAYAASAALEDLANEKGVPIFPAFQGTAIGAFTVLAPSQQRYFDLIVQSEKTPEAVSEGVLDAALEGISSAYRVLANLVKSAWGHEYFPASGTSCENEMSLVQYAYIADRSFLLTGDVGREGLNEAADYASQIGLRLPGIWGFQVPHHGGRHNVNTEVLDRWLGPRMAQMPDKTTWNAVCSSAKADEDHPRKSVIRAMLHRGAHFSATEGRNLHLTVNIKRANSSPVPNVDYPEEQEQD